MFDFTILSISPPFTYFALVINICATIITLVWVIGVIRKFVRSQKTKHIRKIWGIKNGDNVVVVCSELEEPENRQNVEGEFIYNYKYGDVDAYFEVVVTLLRLYPNIKLQLRSSGEAEKIPIDLKQHLILIGGPDFNSMTDRILSMGITQYTYKSSSVEERAKAHPDALVIYDKNNDKEYFEVTDEKDYGYFERIKNPDNPKKKVILLGGCHTIGVTGAVKAFSMFESEQGEIPDVILENAKKVAKMLPRSADFSVLVSVGRVGQTIRVPIINEHNVTVKHKPEDA